MERLILVPPTMEHKKMMVDYKESFIQQGEDEIPGTAGFMNRDSFEDWLFFLEQAAQKETLPQGHVTATTYLALHKETKILIGVINLRHYLNDDLESYGGHIGYSIHPAHRCQGYATEMLAGTLQHAREMGIDHALLTCNSDNLSSARVMEKNGGVFEREAVVDGEIIKRYWISL